MYILLQLFYFINFRIRTGAWLWSQSERPLHMYKGNKPTDRPWLPSNWQVIKVNSPTLNQPMNAI